MPGYGGYGGYGWPYPDAARFFYLAINGLSDQVGRNEADIFFHAATSTGKEWIFILLDISSDLRVEAFLKTIPGGSELFERLKQSPAFLVTTKRLDLLQNVDEIQLIAFEDFESAMDEIYAIMGLQTKSARQAFISFLKGINKRVGIKPGVVGISLNVNELISDLIGLLEAKSP
jgi:hypothetical protein